MTRHPARAFILLFWLALLFDRAMTSSDACNVTRCHVTRCHVTRVTWRVSHDAMWRDAMWRAWRFKYKCFNRTFCVLSGKRRISDHRRTILSVQKRFPSQSKYVTAINSSIRCPERLRRLILHRYVKYNFFPARPKMSRRKCRAILVMFASFALILYFACDEIDD